ncbi:MAG: DUF4935 domain-containing protein [Cytophagaceae bacterium]|nr:MAG: DUF4935 domain-containing protein [Cytophagaceae bacterium]
MLIVLDTSAVIPDFYFQGPSLGALLSECYRVPATIAISEVVRAELVVNHRRRLEKLRDEVEKFRGCFLGYRSSVLPDSQIDDLEDQYVAWVNNHLRLKCIPLPMPSLSHAAIIERMAMVRRPFQEGGRGYKDFLIWRSIIEWLLVNKEDICFVSENKKDFSDASGGMHPDLLAEMDSFSIDRKRIRYYETAKDCYEKEIAPHLEKLNDIAHSLMQGRYEHLDLEKWLYGQWDVVLAETTFDPDNFAPDEGYASATVKGLRRAALSSVFQVTRLGSANIVIEFFVNTTLDLELSRPMRSTVTNRGWNEVDSSSRPFEIHMILSFDETSRKVLNYEVADISPIVFEHE